MSGKDVVNELENSDMKTLTSLRVLFCISLWPHASNTLLKDLEVSKNDNFREEERIVNGKLAVNGMFPWAVALHNQQRANEYICTGSIISPTTVLTAAHCVVQQNQTQPADALYGIVGHVNRSSNDAIRVTFSRVTPHPDYAITANSIENDIAILKTTERLEFSATVDRICLAKPKTSQHKYLFGTIMGWGDTTRDAPNLGTDSLRYSKQLVLAQRTCRAILRAQNVSLSDNQLCTQSNGVTGICKGDSGSPLVFRKTPPVQFGVASFIAVFESLPFSSCANPLNPTVFVRVSSYSDWIAKASRDQEICLR